MNFKLLLLASLSLTFIISCGKKKDEIKVIEDEITTGPSLDLLWKTDSLLTTCESVLFDKHSQTIYVANINNGPWEKDNNGFISKLNINGEITELKWIEGLSAPKGMGMFNGKLYVNDIDNLVEIDIADQKISNKYFVEDNPQLNDLTISPKGVVYFSGSNSNKVHKLENGSITIEADNPSGKRLNGLLWQKEGLYYADFGESVFGLVNNEDHTFKKYSEGLNNADGIVRIENGDFIVSGWKGELHYINSNDWTKTLLLDTKDQSISAADIDYIPETQTLLVPTFFHNRVMAYKLNLPDSE
ncbi:hypothetical protein N1F78_13045 [Seonamhaeicola sp. MEBiC1930]|uniref:hypothetical protein n=1 Tax=Seonamhaeicola sp. MEBiC01930 TaxID=2976768 RepID=UPI0032501351